MSASVFFKRQNLGLERYSTEPASTPGKKVARDDILDALAAAVTAKLGLGCPDNYQLRTLPECPPRDCKDLRMEMVYVERT